MARDGSGRARIPRPAAGLLAACALAAAALIGAPPAHADDLVLLEAQMTVAAQVLSGTTYTGFADDHLGLNFGALAPSTFVFGTSVSSIKLLAHDQSDVLFVRIIPDSGTVPVLDEVDNDFKLSIGTQEFDVSGYGYDLLAGNHDVGDAGLSLTVNETVAVTLTAPGFLPGAPAAPTVSSIAIDGVLHVSWNAPADPGTPPLTGYGVGYRKSGTSDPWDEASTTASQRRLNLASLDAGTAYEVQVQARNEVTDGRWSPSATGTSGTTPTTDPPPLLSALALTDADTATAVVLSPFFVATGIAYRARVAHATTTITVAATAADAGATVAYTPADADTAAGHQVALLVAQTTIVTVTVTSRNAMATQAYTIHVKRPATDVCERTPEVRDAIVAAVSGVSDCGDLTAAHLAGLVDLQVSGQNVKLAAGDFNGLTALRTLDLQDIGLTTLPAAIFDRLAMLVELNLSDNQLSNLPDGIFQELGAITNLNLAGNPGSAGFIPTADAGADRQVVIGASTALDGSGSDGGPWGDNVTYGWQRTSGPAVTLREDDTETPSFAAPATPGELEFTLTVTGRGAFPGNSHAHSDTVTVTVAPPVVVTDADGLQTTEAGGTARFDVALGGEPTANVTVSFASSDTGEGTVSPRSLTFTAATWETAQPVTVMGVDDEVSDGDREFRVTFTVTSTDGDYDRYAVPAVTVSNRDDEPVPTLSVGDVTVAESAGSAAVVVALSGASSRNVTVAWLASTETGDTAAAGADYTAASAAVTVTIAAGRTATTVSVPILQDRIDEQDESFTVTLSDAGPSGAVTIADATARVTITDDDAAPALQFTVSPTSIAETGRATVTVSTGSGSTFADEQTIGLTLGGTATLTDDYTIGTTTLTLPAGSGSTPATVTTTIAAEDDTADEDDETVTVDATHGGAVLGTRHTITITDNDDPPQVRISDVSAEEGDELTFTITVSPESGKRVLVNWATSLAADDTAELDHVAGDRVDGHFNAVALADDFTAVPETALTFAPGDTERVVTVASLEDATDEFDETFSVTLTLPAGANATLADATARGTIVDDDPLPVVSIADQSVPEAAANAARVTVTATRATEKGPLVDRRLPCGRGRHRDDRRLLRIWLLASV